MSKGRYHNFTVLIVACILIVMELWGYVSAQEPGEPPYSGPFAVGNTFCPPVGSPDCSDGATYPTMCELLIPRALFSEPTAIPFDEVFGWTSQLFQPGSSAEYSNLMCAGIPYLDICPPVPGIWGVAGTSNISLEDFESLMFDPNFDSVNKEKDVSDNVTGWWVLIPQVDRVDPMSAPDPNPVIGYVKVHIIAVCASGGYGCRHFGSPAGLCGPDGVYPSQSIVVDRISCFPCGGSSHISVNPISFDFGNTLVRTSSVPQTLSILNDGSGILAIHLLQTIGTHYSEFSIQDDNCSGKLLLPSENCTVNIVFSPETQGEKDASLSLSSNDPDTPILDMPLNGTGIPLIECAVVPDWPVVVQGGTLGLQGFATNNSDEVQIFKYATRITLPNGNKYPNTGYLVGPIEVTLNPHQSKSKHLSQYIPHYAPLGTYTYRGYVGDYGVGIYDECTFNFTVNSQGHQNCTACHQW